MLLGFSLNWALGLDNVDLYSRAAQNSGVSSDYLRHLIVCVQC